MVYRRTILLVGNIHTHRQGFAIQGDATILWEKVLPFLESYQDWDRIVLHHLRRDDPATLALRECLKPRTRWLELPGERERWAVPKREHSWEQHLWHQGRESRRKRRRVQNRLEEHGNYRYQSYTTVEDARAFARIYFRIMVRSWKPPEISRDFFRHLCRHSAELEWFRSYVLFMDDEPVSFQLGFLLDNTYFCYKTAYHKEYASYSPGIAVVDYAITDAVRHGATQIDLLTGDDAYKAIWCNQEIQQVGFLSKR